MYTSILLLVAASFLPAEEAIIVPPASWHNDYAEAYRTGIRDKKPLAIIVGWGKGGWQDVCDDGEIDSDVKELLDKNYVCLYIDASTQSGKKTAKSLGVTWAPSLVIGDRSGTNQALRHKGALSGTELIRTVKRFADVDDVASETQTGTPPRQTRQSNYYAPQQQWSPPMFMGGFGGGGC